jgi:tetratricopeptide (TPR) repeat protein
VNSIELQHELERKIDLYISGRLNQEQMDALWVEMIENPAAYNYLKTSVSLRSIVKNSSTGVSPAISIKERSYYPKNWKRYAAAAVIVVSSGVGGTYVINSLSDDLATSTFKPYDNLELVVYRSSVTDLSNTDVRYELQNAIDIALAGNTSEALIKLNNILESTENSLLKAEAYLNIGILEYNSNDFGAAVVSLQNAAELSNADQMLYERVIWNLAHSQMATGDQNSAKATIQKVITLNGAHSRAAQSYLNFMK